MVTNVTGQFNSFAGEIVSNKEDFTGSEISFSADINSISTGNEQRDEHLKAADFFEAEKYPHLNFVSTDLRKLDDERYELIGNLTIKGVTRTMKLDVEFGGIVRDPWGNTKAGFSLQGKINRKDFDLSFHMVTETGGLLLSDEVKLLAEVQLLQQQNVAEAA